MIQKSLFLGGLQLSLIVALLSFFFSGQTIAQGLTLVGCPTDITFECSTTVEDDITTWVNTQLTNIQGMSTSPGCDPIVATSNWLMYTPPTIVGFDAPVEYNGNYYYLSTGIDSWTNASIACQNAGGHLVVINNEAENDHVEGMISSTSHIGFMDNAPAAEPDMWIWVNGDPVSYTNWGGGQPQNNGEQVAAMQTNGTWHDYTDGAGAGFAYVMEVPGLAAATTPDISCDETMGSLITFIVTDNCGNVDMCQATVFVDDTTAPNIDTPASSGASECQGSDPETNTDYLAWLVINGGALASDICGTVLWSHNAATELWSGACPNTKLVTFTATDDCGNTATTTATFTIDDTTAPTLVGCPSDMTFECSLTVDSDIEDWIDAQLANIRTMSTDICGGTLSAIAYTAIAGFEVPALYNGNLYYLSSGTATWADAEAACVAAGGHLVAINDAGENSFVRALYPDLAFANPRMWIGLTDEATEGTFVWTNGDPFVYENWAGPQPDDNPPGEDYGQFYIGETWNDADGQALLRYMLELPDEVDFPDLSCDVSEGTEITFAITDECGNSSACTATIFVDDSTPPVWDFSCQINTVFTTTDGADCPEDATVSLVVGQEITINDTWTVAGITIPNLSGCVSDACTMEDELIIRVVSITNPNDGCSNEISIEFEAEDECGNTAGGFTCVYTIEDNTSPVWDEAQGSLDQLFNCPSEVIDVVPPTAMDVCSGLTIDIVSNVTNPDPIIDHKDYEQTITYVATDDCGNQSVPFEVFRKVDIGLEEIQGIACHETINLSLDPLTCTGELTPEMLIVGGAFMCLEVCKIEVKDHLGNEIDNFFTYDNVGYPVTYEICCGEFCCWGDVNIEYKAIPEIECIGEPMVINCALFDELPPPPHGELCIETHTEIIDEETTYFECENYIKEVVRTYQVVTKDGIRSNECTQTFLIERLDLEDIEWPDNVAYPDDDPLTCPSDYGPDITGVPYIEVINPMVGGIVKVDLYPNELNEHCDIYTTYYDTELVSSNPCIKKIMRMWKVQKWHCNGEEVEEWPQFIDIIDNEAPHLYAPHDMTVSIDNNDCTARVDLPSINVYDECNPDDIEVDIAYPGGFKDNENGSTVYLEPGVNRIKYIAYDACYNADSVFMEVLVEDHRSPVAICDAGPQVSLNSNGYAAIYAEQLDGGSFDECGPVEVTIAKMDSTCFQDDLIFNDHVQFCCADEGIVLVRLRVTDWAGNVSECMTTVEVANKLVPNLIAPPDTTVECTTTFDEFNLGVQFGNATTFDTCNDDVDEDVEVELECHVGKIVRTFTTSNGIGGSMSDKQTIYFVNNEPFTREDITWPEDHHGVLDICLDDDTKISLPPSTYGEPLFEKDDCDLIGVECKDSLFRVDGYLNACFKIKRTWKVIDWCQKIDGQYPVWDTVQYIEVRDTVKPEIITDAPRGDTIFYKNCDNSLIEIPADGRTNCDDIVTWEWEILDFYDNLIDYGSETIPVSQTSLTEAYLEEGHYKIIRYLRDGCGNFDSHSGDFYVVNKKAPVVYAKFITITPIENNDGDIEATIWASDVDNGSYHPCEYDFELSFSPTDLNLKSMTFYCDADAGLNLIQLWATDENGNQNFVTVEVIVECTDGLVDVTGNLRTESGEGIEGVKVFLHGSELPIETTDAEGLYAFPDMPIGGTYGIEPYKNDDVLNGVSTLDLVMIQKHVLGVQAFNNPYKLMAADINGSYDVSAIDLIELRKLILGIYTDFPSNTSWRFVDDNHIFVDPLNPWLEMIPENYTINPLMSSMDIPFTGVKTGDVNGSVVSNWDGSPEVDNRSQSITFTFERLADNLLIVRSESLTDVEGFQFELQYDGSIQDILSIESGNVELNETNYHLNENTGHFTMSWVGDEAQDVEEVLLYVQVSEAFDLDQLSVDRSRINAELYHSGVTQNLKIVFGTRSSVEGFDVVQMYPNPWSTQLIFELGMNKSENIELIITDVSGRVVYQQYHALEIGQQAIQINEKDVPEAGIYYCRFIGSDHQIQKKMIKMN